MPSVDQPAAFLFTDIEGSTRLWEEHQDAMRVALETHDSLLRAAIEGGGGRVVKTTGDGVLARFEDPLGGLDSALAGQRSLASHAWGPTGPLKVRMALHAGAAHARDGDFFGPALNRGARLLAIGHGGQILVSASAEALLSNRLPPGVGLMDRGDHRLRDLEEPEHVYQVTAIDLPRDFPPLRSLAAGRTNLPYQLSSFVGRDLELAEMRRRLDAHRLVTLIGVGGTGKTRLMLQAAADVVDRYRDGVWVAELAPVSDPMLVAQEIGRSLGVPEQPRTTADDLLTDFLRDKDLLLLLDNCEHLVGTVAALAERLLAACASLTIVASSREALGVPGEVVFQVPSLAVPPQPDPTAPVEPADVAAFAAIRLFVDRASTVLPSFELTPGNASAVVEICRRLDGIPLAIELAAARVTVLSPSEIVQRLDDRFRLLTGGRRTAVPRQQTLQALIDWSWDLLEEPDRRLLRRVSVFAGGWTLDAAAAVCVDDGSAPDAISTLDGLERLVERSLVQVERGVSTRFRLLETIRQYATGRLIESGESGEVRSRHLAWFAAIAQRADPSLRGPDLVAWLGYLDADADNMRAAIDWGLDTDPEAAARLATALWLHWRLRSNAGEGWTWLSLAVDRLRAAPPATDPGAARERSRLMARLLAEAAFAGATWGGHDTRAMAEEAVSLARAVGDDMALSHALAALWTARFFRGETTGLQEIAVEQQLLGKARGDKWMLSMAEAAMANGLRETDPAAASELLEAAVAHARETGNPFVIAFTALTLGRMLGYEGRVAEMRTALEEAAASYELLGDKRFALVARSDLAHGLRRAGELDEAAAILRETIVGWVHSGSRPAVANQLESIAFIAIERGDPARAARLLGAAEVLREGSGSLMLSFERIEYDAYVARLRSSPDPASIEGEWEAGRHDGVAAAVAFAIGDRVTSR